jgi:hypothetical protein
LVENNANVLECKNYWIKNFELLRKFNFWEKLKKNLSITIQKNYEFGLSLGIKERKFG